MRNRNMAQQTSTKPSTLHRRGSGPGKHAAHFAERARQLGKNEHGVPSLFTILETLSLPAAERSVQAMRSSFYTNEIWGISLNTSLMFTKGRPDWFEGHRRNIA